MPAPKGTRPPGGSRKGVPNKVSADVRAMILAALDRAGGEDYLLEQATANPRAFLALVGRILPTQVTGKDDAPLIPDHAAEAEKAAQMLLMLVRSQPRLNAKPADELDRDAG
jgi:hypothetical protein